MDAGQDEVRLHGSQQQPTACRKLGIPVTVYRGMYSVGIDGEQKQTIIKQSPKKIWLILVFLLLSLSGEVWFWL